MNASDMTCIFSTLKFICSEAYKRKVTPVVTFDQPLYWKAQIIKSRSDDHSLKQLVVRLGMFHVQMSFLGCIGFIMEGSGLRDCLEQVYSHNTVSHILSGKAYSRAVRAHVMLDAALHAILLAETFKTPWILSHNKVAEHEVYQYRFEEETGFGIKNDDGDCDASAVQGEEIRELIDIKDIFDNNSQVLEETTGHDDLDTVANLCEAFVSGGIDVTQVEQSESLHKVWQNLNDYKKKINQQSRISKLWSIYIDMINILKLSIRAERTGNLQLHLSSIRLMLPYFAACGHHLYLKSARLYLQQMLELNDTHPEIAHAFAAGYHVMRRSDRMWAGLSSDLMIEQVLMRSLKTSGGLTRGKGFEDYQRSLWLLSSPVCGEVSALMKDLQCLNEPENTKHKESTAARQNKDHNDTRLFVNFLYTRNPFDTARTNLVSIVT